jgi:hypothetical protein
MRLLNTISDGLSSPSLAVQQLGGVVLDVAYVWTDLEGFHLVCGERAQQVDRGRDGSESRSSQRSKSRGWRMTGIRSWTGAINSFASVVMMV